MMAVPMVRASAPGPQQCAVWRDPLPLDELAEALNGWLWDEADDPAVVSESDVDVADEVAAEDEAEEARRDDERSPGMWERPVYGWLR